MITAFEQSINHCLIWNQYVVKKPYLAQYELKVLRWVLRRKLDFELNFKISLVSYRTQTIERTGYPTLVKNTDKMIVRIEGEYLRG